MHIDIKETMEARYINNFDFAKRQQVLEADIGLPAMPRLREVLTDDTHAVSNSTFHFKLIGHSQQYQLPSLHLEIEANLSMVCQRCLESVQVPISLRFDYLVSVEDSALLDGSDEVDWVEQSEAMDVCALIEDELLIALPIAPVHTLPCKQLNLESGEKPNPFSVLKTLKKDGN